MIHTSFPLLTIRGREVLPIIQGDMGVGISGHRLAGAVAKHISRVQVLPFASSKNRDQIYFHVASRATPSVPRSDLPLAGI